MEQPMATTKALLTLNFAIILIALLGLLLWEFVFKDHIIVVAMTIFIISITTFFGVMRIGIPKTSKTINVGSMRRGIAASIVVTYLFMLCILTFYKTPAEIGVISRTFIESFTSLVGITIAFYFGASAATEIFGKKDSQEEESAPKQEGK
jgi:hypothetical protein